MNAEISHNCVRGKRSGAGLKPEKCHYHNHFRQNEQFSTRRRQFINSISLFCCGFKSHIP